MGNELIIRSYNVGCGDCIYVIIPDGTNKEFHMLIDCGTKDSPDALENAIADMKKRLPEVGGHKQLDLIVVTHRHEDHIKGFDPLYFKGIVVKNIWITVAMDKSHPKAKRSRALHAFAMKEMKALMAPGMALSPDLSNLVALYGINNDSASDALTSGKLGEKKVNPAFVFAGDTSKSFTEKKLKLPISKAKTIIRVLGPEEDIDHYYLGKEADARLKGLQDGAAAFETDANSQVNVHPVNISPADFRVLQSRMISNGLAFADTDEKIINNTSTVVLIEWEGRRLLFVGDAEWDGEFKEGRRNGSWNVMWKLRGQHLDKPIDFLKVGHHGSFNATPWDPDESDAAEANQILNAILPLPKGKKKATAKCIVSTKRKQYETIPDAKLLVELGKRVSNTEVYAKALKKKKPGFNPDRDILNYSFMKKYKGEPEPREVGDKGYLHLPQPQRTDFESDNFGDENWNGTLTCVEVRIKPKTK